MDTSNYRAGAFGRFLRKYCSTSAQQTRLKYQNQTSDHGITDADGLCDYCNCDELDGKRIDVNISIIRILE